MENSIKLTLFFIRLPTEFEKTSSRAEQNRNLFPRNKNMNFWKIVKKKIQKNDKKMKIRVSKN